MKDRKMDELKLMESNVAPKELQTNRILDDVIVC